MRIGERDLDILVTFFQRHCDACQRATCSHSTSETIYLAVCLCPDFRSCGFDMGLTVGHIVELIGPYGTSRFAFSQFSGKATGILDVVVFVLVGNSRNFDQTCTAKAQHILLFLRLGLGNDDDTFESHCVADQSKADAGIACCAFDNGAAGAQLAFGNRILDDVERRAIFHRLARIEKLRFAKNVAAGFFRCAFEADQRCIADRIHQSLFDIHY